MEGQCQFCTICSYFVVVKKWLKINFREKVQETPIIFASFKGLASKFFFFEAKNYRIIDKQKNNFCFSFLLPIQFSKLGMYHIFMGTCFTFFSFNISPPARCVN